MTSEAASQATVSLWQWAHTIPEDDRPKAIACMNNVMMISRAAYDYGVALRLFDYLQDPATALPHLDALYWPGIASRDAAFHIYHFGRSLRDLTQNLGGSVSILPTFDRVALRDLVRRFTDRFPDWDTARHSIAHHAEFGGTPAEKRKHGLAPETVRHFPFAPEGGLLTHVEGRKYSVTYMGKLRTVELSHEGLQALDLFLEELGLLFATAFTRPASTG